MSPDTTGNVQIISKLGTGAEGTVYSCYLNGWICAMKEANVYYDSDFNEMSILRSLPPHPNIVRYFFHRSNNECTQLFLQQYSGTLSDLIRQRRDSGLSFTPVEILAILTDIACGMKFLHSNKIIHRGPFLFIPSSSCTLTRPIDLKAENIFVLQILNEKPLFVIGDLDTAKRTLSEKAYSTIGTPCFIAPEVLTSNEAGYTNKVDSKCFVLLLEINRF